MTNDLRCSVLKIDQAIQFHLELDEMLGRKDRGSWPPWVLEIYRKRKIEEHKQKKGGGNDNTV